ncbi:MFS transporter [Rhizobium ruizarguesonis]
MVGFTIRTGHETRSAGVRAIVMIEVLGKLADRIGHWPVIAGALAVAGLLLIPQAFVTSSWQLIILRFLMGVALGGLLPCIAAVIRHSVPDSAAGSILGLSIYSQYVGQVAGPILGGFVGGHIGMRAVFLGTSVLLLAGAAYAWIVRPRDGETRDST